MTGLPLAELKQSPDSFDGIHLELRGQPQEGIRRLIVAGTIVVSYGMQKLFA